MMMQWAQDGLFVSLDDIKSLTSELAPGLDLQTGLLAFVSRAKRLFGASSTSIWLRDPEDTEKLMPVAIDWQGTEPQYYEARIPIGQGLAGRVFAEREVILCRSEDEINNIPAHINGSRAFRQLKSFIGVPLYNDDTVIGVFEVGSSEKDAFGEQHVVLLKTLANFASGFIRYTLLLNSVVKIASSSGLRKLASTVVRETPRLVNGTGASLFLRHRLGDNEPAYLAATSFLSQTLVTKDLFMSNPNFRDAAFYRPYEGITGWVLATGKCLNLALKDGEDRDSALERINVDLIGQNLKEAHWQGKYWVPDGARTRDDYSDKPIIGVPLLNRNKEVLGVLIIPERNEGNFSDSDRDVLEFCAGQIVRAITEKLVPLELVSSLVTAVDAKDPYTEHHSQNVRRLSIAIGRELKLSEEEMQELEIAALMHDIGKIGVPDAILSKPGRINKAERYAIESHTVIGHEILTGISFGGMDTIRRTVFEHHERLDGSGYPSGLEKPGICLAARIVAVADSYDALVSWRPYKEGVKPSEAFKIIKSETPAKYDSKIVDAFEKVLEPVLDTS